MLLSLTVEIGDVIIWRIDIFFLSMFAKQWPTSMWWQHWIVLNFGFRERTLSPYAIESPHIVVNRPVREGMGEQKAMIDWLFIFNAESVEKITSGQNINHQVTNDSLIHCLFYRSFFFWKKRLDQKQLNESGRQTWKTEVKFTAAGEARQAMFWPATGLTERTFDSSGFSKEGTLISTSAVPHCEESPSFFLNDH